MLIHGDDDLGTSLDNLPRKRQKREESIYFTFSGFENMEASIFLLFMLGDDTKSAADNEITREEVIQVLICYLST